MALDLALGLVILIGAIRGYLRGFVLQVIRLSGFLGAFYAAAPLHDMVKPYVQPYLPTLQPELIDRLLWWVCVVVFYFVTTGLATWIYQASRRHPLGDREPHPTDQGARFVLGAAKGFLLASVLAWAHETYLLGYLKNFPWIEQQSETSRALAWSRAQQPAVQVWESAPVRHLVGQIRRYGLSSAVAPAPQPPQETAKTVPATPPEAASVPPETRQASSPTASDARERSRPLAIRRASQTDSRPQPGLDPRSPDFLRHYDEALAREGLRRPPSDGNSR